MATKRDPKKNLIGSVDKAINILKFLAQQKDGATLMQVSKEFSWPHSTVHHILATLKYHGFVQQIPPGRKYYLGMTLFELGQRVLEHFNLVELSMPYLRELTEETKETANLAILDGLDVVNVAQVPSKYVMKALSRVGDRVPAHCTALGKCLLSDKTDEEIKGLFNGVQLTRLTPRSIGSMDELIEHVEGVRVNGYALDEEERELNVFCVAAPIRMNSERVMAAVSVSGPSPRLQPDDPDTIDAVIRCADNISAQLQQI